MGIRNSRQERQHLADPPAAEVPTLMLNTKPGGSTPASADVQEIRRGRHKTVAVRVLLRRSAKAPSAGLIITARRAS